MKPLSRFQMILVLGFIVFGALLWHLIHTIPVLDAVDYLNQLYYVFWHEGMHATTTVFTFGSVEQMMVMHRLGGYVYSSGAAALVVYPAGYIGPVILSCFVLYRSITNPEQSAVYAFSLGVASMLIAGLFTTTDTTLRVLSLGFVVANILLFVFKAKNVRIGMVLYVVVAVSLVVLYLQHIHDSNDDAANLTFLVGASVGGILVFAGATTRVFGSLVVLSVVNTSLLYNAISRAIEMVPQVQGGFQNDPAMLARMLGWSPLFMASLWMAIIALICLITTIAIVRVVSKSQ